MSTATRTRPQMDLLTGRRRVPVYQPDRPDSHSLSVVGEVLVSLGLYPSRHGHQPGHSRSPRSPAPHPATWFDEEQHDG